MVDLERMQLTNKLTNVKPLRCIFCSVKTNPDVIFRPVNSLGYFSVFGDRFFREVHLFTRCAHRLYQLYFCSFGYLRSIAQLS